MPTGSSRPGSGSSSASRVPTRGAIRARCTDLPRDRRRDLHDLIDAACRAAHPAHFVARALARPDAGAMPALAARCRVIAAGKAAAPMFSAWLERCAPQTTRALVTAAPPPDASPRATYIHSAHPFPDERSVAAGLASLDMASTLAADEWLVLLISGGASSMLAAPRAGLTLDDKVATTRLLMHAGADIQSLNRVRSHLSAIKGGGLARAAHGRVVTLAMSDVCGIAEDDALVIGSGPGVVDPSTMADAREVLMRHGVWDRVSRAVAALMSAGRDDRPAAPAHRPAHVIIGSRRDAMDGAASAARARGYAVVVVPEAMTGDARVAGAAWAARILDECRSATVDAPMCVIASGETTVTVNGDGRGGRNQELCLAVARVLADAGRSAGSFGSLAGSGIVVASVGTDGIDGNSPAAGAVVDGTTLARAAAAGIDIADALARNDTFHVFERLGDAIVTGPTATNVGDLQLALVG